MSTEEKRQECLKLLTKIEEKDTPMAAAFRNKDARVRSIIRGAEEGTDAMWGVEYLLKSGEEASLFAFMEGVSTE